MLPGALAALARAEALGRRTAAGDGGARRARRARACPPPAWIQADVSGARAWTAVAGGDVPAACRAAHRGRGLGRARRRPARARHRAARPRPPRPRADRRGAAARRRQGSGRTRDVQVAHVDALARGDAKALASGRRAFRGPGCLAARRRGDRGRRRRPAAGRATEARRATAQRVAEDRASRCEGASTPALSALEARAVLTPAEREAAQLAGAGRSNREIAAGCTSPSGRWRTGCSAATKSSASPAGPTSRP